MNRGVAVKTHLVQRQISEPMEAPKEFARATPLEIPIILVPDDRCWLSCCMTVPSGVYCIRHRFGKDSRPDALADAGLQCAPSYDRVAYCITAQATTYTAPVKSCPTKDNVMVDCDLSLVFQIGPAPAMVKTFVYTLGAARFDEFLASAVEEGIRDLIRSCEHNEIYELRGGNDRRVVNMLRELNRKFGRFGVNFLTAAITDVNFTPELQKCLQDTTNFQSKLKEQEKRQKHALDAIQFAADKEMEGLVKNHERLVQELGAQCRRSEIERRSVLTNEASLAEVQLSEAQKQSEINETRARTRYDVAAREGQRQAQEMLAKAKTEVEAAKIEVEQETKTAIFKSLEEVTAAKHRAEALLAEAEAEAAAAESLRVKREHELAMAKAEVLQAIAEKNRIVISGDAGERLINSMLDDSLLGRIKLA